MATSDGGYQKDAALGAINAPRGAQTPMTIRRLPLRRALILELIALTVVAALVFVFAQHGVPYFIKRIHGLLTGRGGRCLAAFNRKTKKGLGEDRGRPEGRKNTALPR